MAGLGAWRRGRVLERFDAKILEVKRIECESAEGRRAVFTSAGAPDWAIVVPLLERGGEPHCLMVRQYRHGAEGFFLEFPGGVVEAGEEPARGVARELEEETGWRAGALHHAGTVSPNPAFLENRFHVFVATELDQHGRTAFDEHEELETVLVPLAELRRRMGEGDLGNAMMVTGLYLAERLIAASPALLPGSGG